MVSSVAVLSDIHGVMPALDAVLAEPDLQRAGRIVLTGDTRTDLPQDPVDHLPVIPPPATATRITRQQRLDPRPRGISQLMTTHHNTTSKQQPKTKISLRSSWPPHGSSAPSSFHVTATGSDLELPGGGQDFG